MLVLSGIILCVGIKYGLSFAVGIANIIIAVNALWLSYIANQTNVSRAKGLREIKGKFEYLKDKYNFFFLIINTGITAKNISTIENDIGEIIFAFGGSKDKERPIVLDFDDKQKFISVSSNKADKEKEMFNYIGVVPPVTLLPGECFPIFIQNIPPNTQTITNLFNQLKNTKKGLFVRDGMGDMHKIITKKDIKKVLERGDLQMDCNWGIRKHNK